MLPRRVMLFSFLFVFVFAAHSQTSPAGYAARWKTVDSLLTQKGLPQSALVEVNKLYALARRERNEPQKIKALIYRLNLDQRLSEDGLPKAIVALQQEVDSSSQPVRSILENMLAGLYQQYLLQNSYKLNSRTAVANRSDSDVTTWTSDDLGRKIMELYLSSLQHEALLARIDPASYAPIILRGNVSRLRPSLFDLLAHQALDYFKSGGNYTARPATLFEIDDPAAFSEAAGFARHRFSAADTLSLSYQAVLLFQRLIRLHLDDGRPDALVDVDLERLEFMRTYAVMEGRDEAFLHALKQVTDKYGDLPAAAEAWYQQANYYYEQDDDSTGYLKARAICERVLTQADSSQGKTECHELLHTIVQQLFTLQTEEVNIPYKPMRMLVSWKNFDRLYVRLVRLDDHQPLRRFMTRYINGATYDSTWLKKLLALPVYRTNSELLPISRDLRLHRVELPIASLPPGAYMLVAGSDSSFDPKRSIICIQSFAVSAIAYMSAGNHFYVVNRETGQPLAGASVQIWDQHYGSRAEPTLQKGEVYTTDKSGYFEYQPKKEKGYVTHLLEISIPGDHLVPMGGPFDNSVVTVDTTVGPHEQKAFEELYAKCYLFTDRKIYRPGQTVYFKGIIMTSDYETHHLKPLTGYSSTVLLFNANSQTVDTLAVTTNAFGSYHGSFRLPENQLNGRYRIFDGLGHGSQDFSVEEYKRPRFYVEYEKQRGTYRAGDSIRVTGLAKGYAGNVIDGAKVVYHVVRRTRFPYPWMFWRTNIPSTPNQEIAHGNATTDATGKFSLVFFATPDLHVNKNTNAEFDYEISADVTDRNGETRSGTTSVIAGYSAVKLSIRLPHRDHLSADSFQHIGVSIENLAGEPVQARVHLAIYGLKAPQRLIRERLWAAPDRYSFTEKQWVDSFPNDEYREETKKESWERGNALADTMTFAFDSLVLASGRLAPGWYALEATTTDSLGQTVKDLQYVELYDGGTGRPGNPQYKWSSEGQVTTEPGGQAETTVGSSARDVYVIRTLERNRPVRSGVGRWGGISSEFSYLTLSGEQKATNWAITAKDRGGFGVLDAFVKDNRLYTQWTVVHVPWTNKQLDIHYTTFRDKTHPGSEEQWQLKISGTKGEQVTAEVLTTLYDASLDQFRQQRWAVPPIYPLFTGKIDWNAGQNFVAGTGEELNLQPYTPLAYYMVYDELLEPAGARGNIRGAPRYLGFYSDDAKFVTILPRSSPALALEGRVPGLNVDANGNIDFRGNKFVTSGDMSVHGEVIPPAVEAPAPEVQIRKDFRETAFFFPDLLTDSLGNVSFSFTMPEAVTAWKWLTLASTRDLAFGYSEKTVVTQKELMVEPNAPRFLREGDRMELPVKVVNLTDSELTGQMSLQLTDPTNGKTADGLFVNRQPNQYFTVGPRQSAVIGFPLDVPYQYNRPLTYRVVAAAGHYSDGEEATLPVVSNRLLVTESLPLNLAGDGTRHFVFEKLLKSGNSETLNHHSLTVEFTANPAWYAVESLPYLVDYPYECAEQTFERFYANALAARIAASSPRLQQVFDRWRVTDTSQLLSNLQKDQELKTVLLQETPWVLQGQNEEQQKKNLALLFDMHRMSGELETALEKLVAAQGDDGAFPWFKGGPEDRYITQYILTGLGHLQKLGAIPPDFTGKVDTIVRSGLEYLDGQIRKDYEEEQRVAKKGTVFIGELPIQYLYMRSFFSSYGIPGNTFPAVNYYRKKAQQGWVQRDKLLEGMIALALYRTGDIQTAKDIIASLRQNALHNEEQGMYWKGMEGGYYWYEAPIETQSLLIEAFREIDGNPAIDRELKTWLLKQKQTQHWPTTIATADACYALLMGGEDWLNAERQVTVKLGDKSIGWPSGPGDTAGIGYYKKVIDGPFVRPAMGDVTVTMLTKGGGGSPAWGAVYWQYFDMLDRITPTGGPKPVLSVRKRLFTQRNTDRGKVLDSVADNGTLKPGDRVIIRLELRADRDLEYVHMKDMRAACLEPVDVLSGYHWQGGLGYYESTKDVSTDFFFSRMPRGVYIFEYPLTVGQAGNFSNGITTIECLYAPEFTYHTEGIRVNVEAP